MKNNNTSAVRASVRLAGQALFDLPLSEWPDGIDVVAFPDDAATRALVKAACGKTPVTHPTGPFIPCSVMFGSGSVARKSSGFFRLYAQLVYSRRARIRFGTPTLDPDSAKALYYQGVPPAKDRLSEIRQRTLSEPELADLDRTGSEIKRVNRLIKELAARPNPSFTGFFDGILAWFWNRFYQGLDIQGLDRNAPEPRFSGPDLSGHPSKPPGLSSDQLAFVSSRLNATHYRRRYQPKSAGHRTHPACRRRIFYPPPIQRRPAVSKNGTGLCLGQPTSPPTHS